MNTDNQLHLSSCNQINNHIEWIDFAKVMTMILVIIGHTTYLRLLTPYGGIDYSDNFSNSNGGGYMSVYQTVVVFIYTFHMPVFIALSGVGFYFYQKRFSNLLDLIWSRAKRLLAPFICVTILFVVPCKYYAGYWADSQNIIKDIFFGQFLLLGNSHLWFVVSLFYITIAFYIMLQYKQRIGNIVFWGMLILLSLSGYYFEGKYPQLWDFMGLKGLAKYIFYFALGYYGFKWIDRQKVGLYIVISSWIAMLILWIILANTNLYLVYIYLCKSVFIATWGIINLAFTAKFIVERKKLSNRKFYQILKKYNYDLYLYSDPLNYVIIAIAVAFGDTILSPMFSYPIIVLARLIITFIGALTIGWVIDCFRNNIKFKRFKSFSSFSLIK